MMWLITEEPLILIKWAHNLEGKLEIYLEMKQIKLIMELIKGLNGFYHCSKLHIVNYLLSFVG